ncbi:hypothetical protein [Asticcacaulis sp. EMRT-3]|uniref:hypothetical protein n=1 Tax=Asticcacaulis sp. EMRT-3 TaxID=3040349 RepID=UPI0024AFC3E1|nr:hypothetical protein [Asticcacaulis sp. EMRT-3]MDI7776517.1 hypothetical protein [Asticcacaulis sp. EMRT-3]
MNTTFAKCAMAFALITTLVASGASAETRWDAAHPRREQVNVRAAHLDRRIQQERRAGELTRRQAREQRIADQHVRARERFDARHDHGHITRLEKHRLNRAENRISHYAG